MLKKKFIDARVSETFMPRLKRNSVIGKPRDKKAEELLKRKKLCEFNILLGYRILRFEADRSQKRKCGGAE